MNHGLPLRTSYSDDTEEWAFRQGLFPPEFTYLIINQVHSDQFLFLLPA